MDNYDMGDYVRHSSSYFVEKLDEFTGHTNYAACMLKLMEAQYDDYHDDYIAIPVLPLRMRYLFQKPHNARYDL